MFPYLLCSIPFLIPAVGEDQWPLFHAELSSFLLMSFWLWKANPKWNWKISLNILLCISILILAHPWPSSKLVLILCYIGLFPLVVSCSIQSSLCATTLSKTVAISSVILALLGFILYFGGASLNAVGITAPLKEGMSSILGQRNLLANYLFCGVLSCLWLIERKESKRWLVLSGLLLLVISLFMTGSRTVLLYLVLLIVLKRTALNIWHIFAVCIVLVLTFLLMQQLSIVTRQETLLNISHNPRWIMANHSLETFWRNPIFGQGLGEFAYGMWENSTTIITGVPFIERHAHNLLLHILAECGIFGILVMGYCTFLWVSLVKKETPWIFWGIIGVQLIHSMVEFPLWYAQWLCLFGICVGQTMRKQ